MKKSVIVSAPSGAGKTTLVHYLLQSGLDLEFSVSACSRPKRQLEVDGRDYYFLSVPEFKERIQKGDFIEWEEVYTDSFYGTLRSELERIWQKGNRVIYDVDVKGGVNLKKIFGPLALAIFISPPSMEVLASRLKNRSTDTMESLKKRLDKAAEEMTFQRFFDHVIINDDLKTAKYTIYQLVKKFLEDDR